MLIVSRADRYLRARSRCELQGPHGPILLHFNGSLPVTHPLRPFSEALIAR